MNKQFCISSVLTGIASLLLGFVIHGQLLHSDYASLPNLFRPEAEAGRYFPYMLLAHFLIGGGMTWMYRRSPPANRTVLRPGVSFGVALAVLVSVPMYLIYFAVQPMPGNIVAKQIVLDVLGVVLLGILVALLNRPKRTA